MALATSSRPTCLKENGRSFLNIHATDLVHILKDSPWDVNQVCSMHINGDMTISVRHVGRQCLISLYCLLEAKMFFWNPLPQGVFSIKFIYENIFSINITKITHIWGKINKFISAPPLLMYITLLWIITLYSIVLYSIII